MATEMDKVEKARHLRMYLLYKKQVLRRELTKPAGWPILHRPVSWDVVGHRPGIGYVCEFKKSWHRPGVMRRADARTTSAGGIKYV